MIARNSQRVAKEIWTANEAGSLITIKNEADAEMEAHAIVDSIISEQDKFPLREVAIFYRTNSQSRLLEDTLRRQQVNYQIYGSLRFYDRVEIKDIIAWLRLVVNESDDASFRRVINAPRSGIGQRSLEIIEQQARQAKRSLLQQARSIVKENFPKIAGKLRHFVTTFDTLQQAMRAGELATTLQVFLQTVAYLEYLDKKYRDQATEKKENVMELDTALRDFATRYPEATLDDWLQSVVLVGDEMHQSGESVSLMTLHAAKGLEFDRVYVAGVEEGLIPHRNSVSSRAELEEERRLLYVGMTRAKQNSPSSVRLVAVSFRAGRITLPHALWVTYLPTACRANILRHRVLTTGRCNASASACRSSILPMAWVALPASRSPSTPSTCWSTSTNSA